MMAHWYPEHRLVIVMDLLTEPSAGEIAIAVKTVARILAHVGPARRELMGPSRQHTIHGQLPECDDPWEFALSPDDLVAGDPKNKLYVAVDRLIADMPEDVKIFHETMMPGGMDMSLYALHVDTNLCVRILRGFDIVLNLFIMDVAVSCQ